MARPTKDLIVIILAVTVAVVMVAAIAAMATRPAGAIPDSGREAVQMVTASIVSLLGGYVMGRENTPPKP